MKHLAWKEVELEELTPLFHRQLIVGKEIMLARILLKKGCVVPWHSHVNEQVSSIFEGALKFWIDGKEIVVGPGEVLTIPPNMPHKAEAMENTVAIDVFNPPRADWINKTDSYLRKKHSALSRSHRGAASDRSGILVLPKDSRRFSRTGG